MPKKTPFTVEDLYLHRKVLSVHGRAAHSHGVFEVRTPDRDADGYLRHLWCTDGDGGARQLTFGCWRDQSPQLSPDGQHVAFVSDRRGTIGAHVLDLKGGEARAIGQFEGAVSTLRWMPESRALLATASVPVNPDWRGRRGDGPAPKRGPKAPEVAWKLPYKSDGPGYLLANEAHLFHLDVKSGQQRQLTDGAFQVFGFDASPDAQTIAYVRTREGRFTNTTDLWCCDAQGHGHRKLTTTLDNVMQPVWSPDGRWIAMFGSQEEADARSRVWLLEVATRKLRPMCDPDTEFSPEGELQWSTDGKSLYAVRAHRGRQLLVRLAMPTGELTEVVQGDCQVGAFALVKGRLLFTADKPGQPSDLWISALDGAGEKRVTDLNAWWRDRSPVECESREFEVPDGRGGTETIHGWLLRSKDRPAGPQPLLNDAHGGPAAYALLDYDTNVFWQVLCARGWAVLALNAVGSATYGREFCDRLNGRWGQLDLPQHLSAVAQLWKEGVCDERVAISGKSYGGFLSSWAVGHTGKFRAAVVMAPVGNIETHYGTSDGGYYADPVYVASQSRFDREKARALSPLQSIERARTPTLFLQGKEDERCPKCQSEELFVSMMRAGDTPTELVLYPGENHHFLGEGAPSVREDAAQRIVDWVEKWVGQWVEAVEEAQEQSVAAK